MSSPGLPPLSGPSPESGKNLESGNTAKSTPASGGMLGRTSQLIIKCTENVYKAEMLYQDVLKALTEERPKIVSEREINIYKQMVSNAEARPHLLKQKEIGTSITNIKDEASNRIKGLELNLANAEQALQNAKMELENALKESDRIPPIERSPTPEDKAT